MKKVLFTIGFISLFGSVFAQTNLLANPSFETETAAGSNPYYKLSSGTHPDDWAFTPSSAISSSFATTLQPPEDQYWSIQMGASGATNDAMPSQSQYDTLSQAVLTTLGATYNLSYWLRDNDSGTGSFVFNATWNGSVIANTQESLTVPNVWTLYTTTVTGTGGMVTLGLNGYDGPSNGCLDNVSLIQAQATPEPGSIAMIGLGAVSLVAGIRRRFHA